MEGVIEFYFIVLIDNLDFSIKPILYENSRY